MNQKQDLKKLETAYKLSKNYSKIIEESNAKLDEKLLELTLLNETSKTFSSVFDQRNIANFVYSLLKKKVDFNVLCILLINDSKKELIMVSDDEVDSKLEKDITVQILNDYNILAKASLKDDEVAVNKKQAISKIKERCLLNPKIREIYPSLLMASNTYIGMMAMVFCKDHTVSTDDKRFFDIIAGQVALFVENDRIKQLITAERNRLVSVLQSMTGSVMVVDDNSNIVLVNQGAEMLFNVKNHAIVDKNLNDINVSEKIKNLVKTFLKQKNEYLIEELELENDKDETIRIFKANLAKVHDYLGKIIGAVLILFDITKEKDVDRLKTEFISITSHELRTPLAAIKQSVSLIIQGMGGEINDIQREFLNIADRNIDRLAGLINDLLDLSKIESGKMELNRMKININDVINESIETFKALAEDKKIKLKSILKNEIPEIKADKARVSQVIVNLLSNAIKFCESGDSVVLESSLSKDSNFVQVSVKDSGPGIDKKDIGKLFGKFQQIDSSYTRKVGGTGLGLSISKEIIGLHGGKIWVDTKLDEGSTFSFTLPIVYSQTKIGQKKILVVDDEVTICSLLKTILEANNYNVATAFNGENGLELTKDFKPDLIILDIIMPTMNGFEVAKKLKADAQTSTIPIIMITGIEDDEAAKKAYSIGAEGYLNKPIVKETLLFTLKQYLE